MVRTQSTVDDDVKPAPTVGVPIREWYRGHNIDSGRGREQGASPTRWCARVSSCKIIIERIDATY